MVGKPGWRQARAKLVKERMPQQRPGLLMQQGKPDPQ